MNLKNVSQRDIQIYVKREKLEREYQKTCGQFLDEIKAEKQHKWNQFDIKKRGGVKTLAQVMSEQKFVRASHARASKPLKINHSRAPLSREEKCQNERLKRGFHSIIQNPRKYFKDVIGEKKSIFAKELIDVKNLLQSNQETLKKKRKLSLKNTMKSKQKSAFYSHRKERKK